MNQNQKEIVLANASRVIDKKHIIVLIKDNQGRAIDMHEFDVFNDIAYNELKNTVLQNKAILSQEKAVEKERLEKAQVDKELAFNNNLKKHFEHTEILATMNMYYIDIMRGIIDEDAELEEWFNHYLKTFGMFGLPGDENMPKSDLFWEYWALIHKGETL